MNSEDKLYLKKMIDANNVKDQTKNIQKLKHSSKIIKDIEIMSLLKNKHRAIKDSPPYYEIMKKSCNFLYTNYLDIFNKILYNKLNIDILYQFLEQLKQIEENKTNQHEASYKIGKLLKELYIDTVVSDNNSSTPQRNKKNISWNET